MLSVVLIPLLVALVGASHGGEQLDYDNQKEWGGVCQTGNKQSPIDIPVAKYSEETGESFIDIPASVSVANHHNLNTIKYYMANDSLTTFISWKDRTITLMQVHLHWGGSEHLIAGKRFAAESHLVTSYQDGEDTKYMVFARLFKVGRPNREIGYMIKHQKSTGKEIKTLRRKMHLNRLYPARAGSWLNYSGGLTTPGCDEVVDWVVVPELLEISKIQLDELATLHLGAGDMSPLSQNYRAEQPGNGRQSTLWTQKLKTRKN